MTLMHKTRPVQATEATEAGNFCISYFLVEFNHQRMHNAFQIVFFFFFCKYVLLCRIWILYLCDLCRVLYFATHKHLLSWSECTRHKSWTLMVRSSMVGLFGIHYNNIHELPCPMMVVCCDLTINLYVDIPFWDILHGDYLDEFVLIGLSTDKRYPCKQFVKMWLI